ncbi:MAG TPA: hypothetical protein VM658_21135 [bacterium]|nr:hypothetical protein [bacterium]
MDTKDYSMILAAVGLVMLALLSAPARADGSRYGKVRTPVVPGLKWLYTRVTRAMVAPNVEDVGSGSMFETDLAAEAIFGASNYATALGNGRLFVEISPWAELTVFRWPNPTYSDQLRYFTLANGFISLKPRAVRMGDNAPCRDWNRYGRPMEPCPGLGSSGGVVTAGGQVIWSHDPVWQSSRRFEPESGTALVTELQGDSVTMAVEDFIHPELDLMARSFTISGPAKKFLYHATFAPFMARPGEYTASDPKRAGFAAIYLEGEDLIIHFQPQAGPSAGKGKTLECVLSSADLDRAVPGGVFIAWGLNERSDEHQVGADECPKTDKQAPQSGRSDARDGALGMNGYYEGKVDAALARRIEGDDNKVTVWIAIAGSAREAARMIARARQAGPELKKESVEHWLGVSSRVCLPAAAGETNARVARRAILNLIQGQDKEGGCIVASISRQPAYNFDWPRDGAFFDLALDLAGFPELTDKHHDFYGRTQFRHERGWAPIRMSNFQAPFFKPAGHWPSNMAADGSYGSVPKLMPFEIDETALMAWDMWRHRTVLPAPRAGEYAARMKPVLERCANALMDYVDVKQGWTRPALEDDNFPPAATLHGAAAVLTGLASACDASASWGIGRERSEKWCEAARALRAGIRARIGEPGTLENAGWRGQAWSLWPAPIFENYDEPEARAIKQTLAQSIEEKISRNTPGFAYLGEEIFILALADQERGEYRDLLVKALEFMTGEVPFPGTDCYGEVTVWRELSGEKLAQQRTSIPHIWNGVTAYLAVAAVYEPRLFKGAAPPSPGAAATKDGPHVD